MIKRHKILTLLTVLAFIASLCITALTPSIHLGTTLFLLGIALLAVLFSKLEDKQIKELTGYTAKKTRR